MASTLRTRILGIDFENPFLLASAPPTARIESIAQAFEMGWGGAVLKTITPDNMELHEASPRYAVLQENNRLIGFQNIELLSHQTVEYWCDGIQFLKQKYPSKVLIANVMAPVHQATWQELIKQLDNTPLDGFELGLSCPHGILEKGAPLAVSTDGETAARITQWVKQITHKPVFVKLSPNVTDISSIGRTLAKAGADGLTAIDTVAGFMGINLQTLRPLLNVQGKTSLGGCSGPMVRPIGLRCVAQLRQACPLPILGVGGISSWEDAAQYIAAGADAVQVCTEVMLNGYKVIGPMLKNLQAYLEEKNFADIKALQNIAAKQICSHEDLPKKLIAYPHIDFSKCVRCGKCVMCCGESEHQALALTNGKIQVDKTRCVGCGLCRFVCPSGAITNASTNAVSNE